MDGSALYTLEISRACLSFTLGGERTEAKASRECGFCSEFRLVVWFSAMAAAQLSVQCVSLKSTIVCSRSNSSGNCTAARCPSLSMKPRCLLGCSSSSGRGRNLLVVCAKKGGKERNGGVAEAVESAPPVVPVESSEGDDMWMGRKLEGLEPDFWEGEQWEAFGFLIQYLWAFGVIISLVACGVAVRTYNTGATDFKDTAVFKEAMDSQLEMDSSVFDQAETQGFKEPVQAPPIE